MTDQSMLRPDSSGAPSSGRTSTDTNGFVPGHDDVAQVAQTLAAHAGGIPSFDLALDLVLNDIVEQARLATSATGAAIALARYGEIVCRATTGANAPELGARLDATTGLSGACMQTGQIQQCSDTETDPRVNAQACRQLGVRSILVLPLGDGAERFGVLEVFSPNPGAFGERDLATLQALARRVVEDKREAERAMRVASEPQNGLGGAFDSLEAAGSREDPAGRSEAGPGFDQIPSSRLDESIPPSEAQYSPIRFEEDTLFVPIAPRKTDIWTSVLGVLVIVVAILLGLAIGWRGGSQGFRGGERTDTASSPSNPPESSAGQPGSASQEAAPAAKPPSTAKSGGAGSVMDIAGGGLLVTQNGKVIYRLPPSKPKMSAAHAAADISATASDTRLIHRVEPEYPAQARAQRLQGSVVLDVQIAADGTIRNVSLNRGDPVLAEAAIHAVRQWKYQPYAVDGRPVEMQTQVTIKFTLPIV
jgi:TonB family protein